MTKNIIANTAPPLCPELNDNKLTTRYKIMTYFESFLMALLPYRNRRNIQRKKLRKQKYMELVDYKINNNLHNY